MHPLSRGLLELSALRKRGPRALCTRLNELRKRSKEEGEEIKVTGTDAKFALDILERSTQGFPTIELIRFIPPETWDDKEMVESLATHARKGLLNRGGPANVMRETLARALSTSPNCQGLVYPYVLTLCSDEGGTKEEITKLISHLNVGSD